MAGKSICTIDGCDKAIVGRGWCGKHYRRWKRHGDPLGGGVPRFKNRICTIEGCGRKHSAHGLCDVHYERAVYGRDMLSPVGSYAQKRDGVEFIETVAVNWTSDICLEWPFGRFNNGYGTVLVEGRNRGVHVIVCERVHGGKPAPSHEVAHSCGNRSCCNPRHLRWATRSENFQDKLIHGTDNRGERHNMAKLTESEVREIRALAARCPYKEIAARFSITEGAVSMIKNRRAWAWLD